jgi:prophage antirepressor-like protein
MNDMKEMEARMVPFMFEGGREVRAVERDGNPWFVAKDVCGILGLENVTEALRNFPENEVSNLSNTEVRDADIPNRGVNIINELGLYRLIFQSRKPEAEAFKTWVFTEVLPAIRKRGFYALPSLIEKAERLIERQGALLDDPQKAVYAELEDFVQKNLEIDEKRIYKVPVWSLYRAYTKAVDRPLNQHDFMHKIALDHPEFELRYMRKEWAFIRCMTKWML